MRFDTFDKTAARREFKKRNYVFLGVFVGAIPGIPILSYAWVHLFGFENAPGVIAVAWMIALTGVGIWRTSWKCPRCHQYFFRKWWYSDVITMHCLHCDLRPDDLIEDFIPKDR